MASVRRAAPEDSAAIAALLYRFNREYDEPTPGVEVLAELNTAETDAAARALYESTGFTNREGRPDGPRMLYYEREL